MLVGLLYIHVLLKEIMRYAYFILNAADDLGLMTVSYLHPIASKHLGLLNFFLTCSRSTNVQVSNHGIHAANYKTPSL